MTLGNLANLTCISLFSLIGLTSCTVTDSNTAALLEPPVPAINSLEMAAASSNTPLTRFISDERAGLTDLEVTPDSCIARLEQSQHQSYPDHYALPDEVSLVSWNIYKAQHQNLASDLAHLNSSTDILLLQEALLNEDLVNLKPFWRFAPGYKSGELQSGVLTLSRWPATVHCHFAHVEPWLRTPKATNVVEYLMHDGQRLLAINLHAINFSFGLEDYRKQLDDAIAIIEHHKGPVVFAGDLNSWSLRRGKLLDERLKSVGLEAATFNQDNRTRFWGQPLDSVWVRGININSTEVPVSSSSDHNPILVSFNMNHSPVPEDSARSVNTIASVQPDNANSQEDSFNVIEN